MNKNNQPVISQNKLLEDAAKKLQKIEKGQKNAEKYFKDREKNQQKLKLLESSLKKKVKMEKRLSLGLEEKTVEKMQTLLKSLVNVDMSTLMKIDQNFDKVSEYVQTEQEDTQILKDRLANLEKENEKNISKKGNLKKEIEIIKAEMEELKIFNNKIMKENKLLQQNLEDVTNTKNILQDKVKELMMNNETLAESLKKNEKNLKEFENLKKIMEEKLQVQREEIELEDRKRRNAIEQFRGNIKLLAYFNLIEQVTVFLPANDINSLKMASKDLHFSIERNLNCQKQMSKELVLNLKKKLAELSEYDLKKDYMVNDIEVEKLIKDYVKSGKLPGRELKSSINKAIVFLNKDVKTPLGIKTGNSGTGSGNITPKPGASNYPGSGNTTPGVGILGGFGSLFGGMFGQGHHPQGSPIEKKVTNSSHLSIINSPKNMESVHSQSKASSRGMSIAFVNEVPLEIDKFDKSLISENSTTANDIYEFEYAKPEDIRNILNKFLKSNFSTDKLTSFIKEVCLEYSELLFFAFKCVQEIKELELVKNALNERYKRYHKLSNFLQSEVTDLKKMFSGIQPTLNKDQDNKMEEKYYSVLTENTHLKEVCEVSEKKLSALKNKEEKLISEYESFKVVFLKEIRNLRFDLQEVTKQRNTLRDVLIEFKSYFNGITSSQFVKLNQ